MSYHDYVIKNGKLVGRFEEMYRDCVDPWHQSGPDSHELSRPRHVAILHMKRFGIRSVVEVGSGLGFYTNMIHEQGIDVLGLEISETAVEKARGQFPALKFEVGDTGQLSRLAAYDAVLLAEVTWYMLDSLPQLYADLLQFFPGKFLLQNLTFYPPGRQQYGKEHFTTFQEFAEKCPLKLLEWTESRSTAPDSIIGTSSVFRVERK